MAMVDGRMVRSSRTFPVGTPLCGGISLPKRQAAIARLPELMKEVIGLVVQRHGHTGAPHGIAEEFPRAPWIISWMGRGPRLLTLGKEAQLPLT